MNASALQPVGYPLRIRTRKSIHRKCVGSTLAEVLVAIGLFTMAFSCFYAATGQAVRIAQGSKQETSASQVLQHRFETFHGTKAWSTVLTPTGISAVLAVTPAASTTLHSASESYVVSAQPAGTPQFTITRSASGIVTVTGTALPANTKAVKIAGQLNWTGLASRTRTRQQVTLLTEHGI